MSLFGHPVVELGCILVPFRNVLKGPFLGNLCNMLSVCWKFHGSHCHVYKFFLGIVPMEPLLSKDVVRGGVMQVQV